MKVKINNLKLIVKKEKGGDIPKFEKSGHIERRWYGNVWVEDKPKKYKIEKRWYGNVSVPDTTPIPLVDRTVTDAEIAEARKFRENAEIEAKARNTITNTKSDGTSKPKNNKRSPRSTNIPKTTNTPISSFTNNGTEELTGNFGQAFLEARRRGLTQFNWKGASYGTRMANENDATWRNNMSNAAAKYTATLPTEKELEQKELKPENTIVETQKPTNTLNTPYTYWYQQSVLNNKPEMSRHMLLQATQDVRNGVRDASYYGESADLISSLSKADQDSAKNYIYNMWNTDADIANQEGRKYFTESLGLTFGEPNNKYPRMIDKIANWYNLNKSKFTFAKNGSKLISRKK